jgi:hypothetical protein
MSSKLVPKTQREAILNDYYMIWVRSDGLIPDSVVNAFRKRCEEIKRENPIYNDKNI